MSNALVRWTLPIATFVILGPLAAGLTSMMTAPDGSHYTPALLSAAPLMGLILVLAAVGVAGAAGILVSRFMGPGYGLFCAGMVLAWAAWPTGTVEDVLRRTQRGDSLWRIAIEGLIVGAALTAIGWLIIRAHPAPAFTAPPPRAGGRTGRRADDAPGMDVLITGLAAVIIGAGIGVFLAAQESLKGQAIGAAFLGGILGGVAARLSAERCPTWILVAGMAALAALSPAVGAVLHGDAALRAAYGGSLFNLAKLMPLDWLAGGFMGIPIGLSWAGGMIEERQPEAPTGSKRPAGDLGHVGASRGG